MGGDDKAVIVWKESIGLFTGMNTPSEKASSPVPCLLSREFDVFP